jgi:predicted amidohydrolase YtcJ
MLHRQLGKLLRRLRAIRSSIGNVFFSALLLVNGKIWTGDPQKPIVQAIAISGDRIAAVGSDEEILKLGGGKVPVGDLQGKLVLPGFNDAHVHFFAGGRALAGPQLRTAKSAEDFRDTLAEFAKHQPHGHWIQNGEWDNQNWSNTDLPTHDLIDPVTRHWPVFVSRMDGHMGLANSVALEKAGIDKNTKDVPGGAIVRDDRGNPTGILKDAAQTLLTKVIPPPADEEIRDAIRAAQTYANAQGVTSVQDMSASAEIVRVYQLMLKDGELHVRIAGHQPLTEWKRQADVGVTADFGNEWVHIGGVKGFADGSLGSGTALFFKPYSDDPKNSGIPSAELSDPKQMWLNIRDADAAGLQIAVHAIGDKANHEILNMYERLEWERGNRDRRLRIEHAQHLTPADIQRFAALHVIASMQPYQCIDDGRWAEKRIGPERAKTTFAFHSLLSAGAILAFGSDWPVVQMSPLMGIYAAVTRQTLDGKHPDGWAPEQKITVADAVRAYTIGSAFASYDDQMKGSLKPGKLADLIVLSDDIFSIDAAKIPSVKVEATIVGGRLVMGQLPRKTDPSGLLLR